MQENEICVRLSQQEPADQYKDKNERFHEKIYIPAKCHKKWWKLQPMKYLQAHEFHSVGFEVQNR